MAESSNLHHEMLLRALLAEREVAQAYRNSPWFKQSLDVFAAMLPSMVRGMAEEAQRQEAEMRVRIDQYTKPLQPSDHVWVHCDALTNQARFDLVAHQHALWGRDGVPRQRRMLNRIYLPVPRAYAQEIGLSSDRCLEPGAMMTLSEEVP